MSKIALDETMGEYDSNVSNLCKHLTFSIKSEYFLE